MMPSPAPDSDKILKQAISAFSTLKADAPERAAEYDNALGGYRLLAEDYYKQRQENEQKFRRQINRCRAVLLYFLISFMLLETVALYVIVVEASIIPLVLNVDERTLQILVGGTITQVSAMLIVIIRSVYSEDLNKIILTGNC